MALGTRRRSAEGDVLNLRIGEIVEVRSESEILATLDENGELESLPFMPEMLQFCGRRFRVEKLAVKTCDTIGTTGLHRMRNAVHLQDLRCDGRAHDGCQAGCFLFWKEAWLKRAGTHEDAFGSQEAAPTTAGGQVCTRETLTQATRRRAPLAPPGEEAYSCQATELMRAAPERLHWLDLGQYVRDVRSGNVGAMAMIRGLIITLFNKYQGFSRRYLPRPLWIWGARKFPRIEGKLTTTPRGSLGLAPGEPVKVKSKEEIFSTLDVNWKNRGLSFDPEMVKFCGNEARVLRRVDRIINEKTGRMMRFDNPCIVLEGVICSGDYHLYCPRAAYPYWREIWLQRAEENSPPDTAPPCRSSTDRGEPGVEL